VDEEKPVEEQVLFSKETIVAESRLKSYSRDDLDVLFIALNPPEQSNSNKHYFSGKQSRFFKLLAVSGLITQEIPKACADERVFGTKEINYRGASFGVADLVSDIVETRSGKVRVVAADVLTLVSRIRSLAPRFACVIHSKVLNSLNRHGGLVRELKYGWCGLVLRDCATEFVVNYFPNGNSITDGEKVRIFCLLRDRLE
jgi:hypothetical protein